MNSTYIVHHKNDENCGSLDFHLWPKLNTFVLCLVIILISGSEDEISPDKDQTKTSPHHPFVFPNIQPWKSEEEVDADKQINMYYVNNVEIHA